MGFFGGKRGDCFVDARPGYVAQASLILLILLLQPAEFWDYRCERPQLLNIDIPLGVVVNCFHLHKQTTTA